MNKSIKYMTTHRHYMGAVFINPELSKEDLDFLTPIWKKEHSLNYQVWGLLSQIRMIRFILLMRIMIDLR